MDILFIFPSFFASTRIPINFYQPISQGAIFLQKAPPLPLRQPPRLPGPVIGTLNIRDDRGYRLAQAIQAVERGNLDSVTLKETIRTEECSKKQKGYNVGCAVARSYRASGARVSVVLGYQERPNGWGSKSTLFHRTNVVN